LAQDNDQLKVTVPFDFMIGTRHLAAGSYTVERESDYALEVRNNQTRKGVFLMVRGEDNRGALSSRCLVFERTGRGMSLTEAWFGTNEHVKAVAKPKRELQYAKQNPTARQSIEIALK
jgi:hypothetical protein